MIKNASWNEWYNKIWQKCVLYLKKFRVKMQQLCTNSTDKPRLNQKLITPNYDFDNTVFCALQLVFIACSSKGNFCKNSFMAWFPPTPTQEALPQFFFKSLSFEVLTCHHLCCISLLSLLIQLGHHLSPSWKSELFFNSMNNFLNICTFTFPSAWS